MIVKKYEAPTMKEALAAVKQDLGSDAVILHTKTQRRNGLLGLWGKEMVEISASRDINLLDKPQKSQTGNLIEYYKKSIHAESGQVRKDSPLDLKLLHSDLNEVKSLVMSLMKRSKHADISALSDELLEAYLLLIEQEVSEELSKEIISKIHSELSDDEIKSAEIIQRALLSTVIQMIPSVEPITLLRPSVVKKVALVGPTGVGKTTTIAKLAADFSLRQNKDVALITIDTYRIAAVEQLRTYAEIINIPLEVVLTPNEVRKAIEKHKNRDLILIDTAGRSQKNVLQMSELKGFIDAIAPHETNLVLSTTTNDKHMRNVIEQFSALSIDKIIFTKLDEAISFGLIFNVMSMLNKSLSYVTIGQNVPDDIAITDPHMLARLIVEGEKNAR